MSISLQRQTDISDISGLAPGEAASRLAAEGYNELPSNRPRRLTEIAFGVVREPMFLLLFSCGAIYLFLGDIREALMLLGFVAVVMGISLYQERKTERALEALRDLSSPRALVIRGGEARRIPGRELVRGDFLILAEGDRIPADACLVTGSNFHADESLLTGESVPVRKRATDGTINAVRPRPGGDDLAIVYAGTLVVQGKGIAEVLATGMHTEIGHIGRALKMLGQEDTSLQRDTARLVRQLALVGLIVCAIVVVVYGLTRGDWVNGVLAGLATAMAILPEEFPVVLTIFLALGAWRISREHVLTRRIAAIESLGAATVLCVDKTGTLTQNQMSVKRLYVDNNYLELPAAPGVVPERFHELVEFAILASQRDPFDPMEKALRRLGREVLGNTEHLHDDWSLMREYSLSPQLLALSHVWRAPQGREYVIAAKGAPEAIADLCHLTESQTRALVHSVGVLAADGLRVLGVAKSEFGETQLPGKQHDFTFGFLGLVGLEDPVRPSVPAAVAACRGAGIRVVMITGDYAGTARSIALQIGLNTENQIVTGAELDVMTDVELRKRIGSVSVFARVAPEQKLRIVEALKANGDIVAMTGDGVNDAPALKAAHIGVAMGGRGTDVARESAALVLLDDDFSSIVNAVRLGRRVADNLRRAMAFIVAAHVPIIGLSLIPVLLRWPLVLGPVHIAFLQLIIDPACSIVFEAEAGEPDLMQRSPRDPKAALFDRRTIALSIMQGLTVMLIVVGIFAISLWDGLDESKARALSFVTLVVSDLALIFTNRSWSRSILATLRSPNRALWWVVGGTLLVLGVVLYIPAVRILFRFGVLPFHELLFCLAAGLASVLWFELRKPWLQGR